MDSEDPIHRQIELALRMSARLDKILSDNATANILPPVQRREFSQCAWVFLACQTSAARHFIRQGSLLFDVTVKSHHLGHWALQVAYINPRKGWCYSGEAFMHKMKLLGASSVKGNNPAQAAIKMICKNRYGLHFLCSQSELRQ